MDSEMVELQSGMVGETGGDVGHGRVQTCDTSIKRGGAAAPASLRYICELDTITTCGTFTPVGAIHRQHIQAHTVDASRWVAILIQTDYPTVAIPDG